MTPPSMMSGAPAKILSGDTHMTLMPAGMTVPAYWSIATSWVPSERYRP